MTIFDIETSSLPEDKLNLVKPEFSAPGNYKKPEAIRDYIIDAENAWKDRAALSAITGEVIAIGYAGLFSSKGASIMSQMDGNESGLLQSFWDLWSASQERFVGFNIVGFDLPFLFQRSIINGVSVPPDLREGRWWNSRFVDLQQVWCCYSNRTEGQSLDAICKACGFGGKVGRGKDFAGLWRTDRKAAETYLLRDVEITCALAMRMLAHESH